ncbi:energy transducer TonB [Undibacterium parvum]|uniref:Energy transducer TonB n=1 Tax=Undibacterium parvum TaxID=401471 RepID=A0A3Q9BRE3_9BURK|nr:energy transducer TonB [Undibacterium parvum]AZP12818.1 energy transducer TonB [Undibacterium parvum]
MTLTMNPHDQPASKTRHLAMLAIVLGHLLLLYALQQGAFVKVAQAIPKEIFINVVEMAQAEPPSALPPPPLSKPLTPPPSFIAPPPEVQVLARSTPDNAITAAPAQTIISKPSSETSSIVANTATSNATAAPPKLVSGVEYLQAPQADYPALARRMGEEGKVSLLVLVNEKGRAEKVEIQKSSGSHRLDEAARVALMRALFKPYIEDGKALMMLATATISFSLNG